MSCLGFLSPPPGVYDANRRTGADVTRRSAPPLRTSRLHHGPCRRVRLPSATGRRRAVIRAAGGPSSAAASEAENRGLQRWAGSAALMGATACWAINNVGVKILITKGVQPGVATAVRFFFVAAAFLPFLKLKMLLTTVPLSFLAFGGNACLAMALKTTTSGRTSFFSSLAIVFIPFTQRLMYGKKAARIDARQWLAVALSLSGIFFMSRAALMGGDPSIQGDSFATLASLCFGTYTTLLSDKKYAGVDTKALTAALRVWSCFFAVMWALGLAVVRTGGLRVVSEALTIGWGPLAALGGLASLLGAAAVFQVYGQRRVTSIDSGIVYTIQPVWGAILGYLILGEKLTRENMFGAALIMAGVMSATLQKIKARDKTLKASDESATS